MTKKQKKSSAKEESNKPIEAPVQPPAPQQAASPVVPEAPKEPVYEPKPLELSRKSSLANKSQGLPKSKKPWKTGSSRSGKHTKINPKTWKQKMDDKRALQAIRQRVREEKEKKKDEVR